MAHQAGRWPQTSTGGASAHTAGGPERGTVPKSALWVIQEVAHEIDKIEKIIKEKGTVSRLTRFFISSMFMELYLRYFFCSYS